MKVLAIDYGSKRIGLATGDLLMGIAFPREVIQNDGLETVSEKILSVCNEMEIERIVLGLPLNMKSSHQENEILEDVRALDEALSKNFDGDILMIDERLSTFEAQSMIDDFVDKHGKKDALGRDAYAACVILQRYFDQESK